MCLQSDQDNENRLRRCTEAKLHESGTSHNAIL